MNNNLLILILFISLFVIILVIRSKSNNIKTKKCSSCLPKQCFEGNLNWKNTNRNDINNISTDKIVNFSEQFGTGVCRKDGNIGRLVFRDWNDGTHGAACYYIDSNNIQRNTNTEDFEVLLGDYKLSIPSKCQFEWVNSNNINSTQPFENICRFIKTKSNTIPGKFVINNGIPTCIYVDYSKPNSITSDFEALIKHY